MTHSFSVEQRWSKDMGGGPGLGGEGRWRRRRGGRGLMGSRKRQQGQKSGDTLYELWYKKYCLVSSEFWLINLVKLLFYLAYITIVICNDLFLPLTTSEYLVSSKQTHSCFISIKRHLHRNSHLKV